VNLAKRITDPEEFKDPNTIKVVMDKQGFALYFSREPIPTARKLGLENIAIYKQVCIIPFRKDWLLTFTKLPPTPLETAESIDMLRFLEHGYRVRMVESPYYTYSVDTPEDLIRVEHIMRHDPLVHKYLQVGDSRQ
jgi:3-deoxy-manno-octulosonate cytidylyltransferase (CMP-KDO synthetase)